MKQTRAASGLTDALFDYSPVPLWEFDLSGIASDLETIRERLSAGAVADQGVVGELFRQIVLRRVNRAALDLYGVQSIADLQERLPHIITPESFMHMLPGMLEISRGAVEYETETVHRTSDGRSLSLQCKLAAVPDYDPPLGCVILSTVDITSVKAMTEQLALLSLLPDTNPNIVLIVNVDGTIAYANPAAREWLTECGYTDDRDLNRLLPDETGGGAWLDVTDSTPMTYTIRRNGRIFDGKIRSVSGQNRCMVTLTDVTEFQRVTRERELYYQAFVFSRNPIFITDLDGNIVYANPEFVSVYGIDPVKDGPIPAARLNPGREAYADLEIPYEEYDDIFRSMWRDITDSATGFWSGELPNRRADGSIMWVHLYINAIKEAGDEETHFLAIPVDISEDRAREQAIRLDIYQAITDLAETRDNDTGEHIVRVGSYARLIAGRLGQSTKFCEDIQVFAQLHDIGKVGISDDILLAPRRLTAEEFELMKTHTTLGYQILAGKEPLSMAADIVRCHHERWDGAGYPEKLAGQAIPLAARIVSVVDVYDALRSRRPYKEPWDHQSAVLEIDRNSGTQFDPTVVAAFHEVADQIAAIFGS